MGPISILSSLYLNEDNDGDVYIGLKDGWSFGEIKITIASSNKTIVVLIEDLDYNYCGAKNMYRGDILEENDERVMISYEVEVCIGEDRFYINLTEWEIAIGMGVGYSTSFATLIE